MCWGATSLRHGINRDLKDKKPALGSSGGREFLPPEEGTASAKALGQKQAFRGQSQPGAGVSEGEQG